MVVGEGVYHSQPASQDTFACGHEVDSLEPMCSAFDRFTQSPVAP